MNPYIESVRAKNFEGASPIHVSELSRVVLIHGNNSSGKTRILRAVRVGLVGYEPALGERARDTMMLASERKMQIAFTVVGSPAIHLDGPAREFETDGDGVSREKSYLPEQLQDFPAVLLDLNEFFDMTQADRIQHVFSLDKSAKLTASDLVTAIKLDSLNMADRPMPIHVSTLAACFHEIEQAKGTAQALCDSLIASFDLKRKKADGEVKSYKGADTAGMVLSAGEIPPNREVELEAARKALQDERIRYGIAQNERKNTKLSDARAELSGLVARRELDEDSLPSWRAALKQFDKHAGDSVCSECGQKLPKDKQAKQKKAAEKSATEAKQQVSDLEARIAKSKAAESALKAQIAKLEQQEREFPALDTSKGEAIAAKVKELEAAQQAYVRYTQDKLRAEQARTARAKSEAELTIYKAVIGIIKDEREKACAKSFGQILETARRFTDGILPLSLVFHNGDLAMQDGDRFVSHKTFSGIERLVAYTGLSVALAAQAPLKVVLLDEMGWGDLENRTRIIKRMVELTEEGVIHQAFLTDSLSPEFLGLPKLVGKDWMKVTCVQVERNA